MDEIDLRDLSPRKRHSKVFEVFEDLDHGETLRLINDHDPSPLIHQMQAEFDYFDNDRCQVKKEEEKRFVITLPKKEKETNRSEDSDRIDKTEIKEVLRGVTDPDLRINVIESGLVTDIRTDQSSSYKVTINPSGMAEPKMDIVRDEIKRTLKEEMGLEEVRVVPRRSSTQTVSEEEVWNRLKDVGHPDKTDNVVQTEMVTDVGIDGNTVTLEVDPPELGGELDEYREEVFDLIGTSVYNINEVKNVRVDTGKRVIDLDPPTREDPPIAESPEMGGISGTEGRTPFEQEIGPQSRTPPTIDLSGIDDIIVVASAKGGVGKTTVATQLARALAEHEEDIGLLDTDFSGPDVPQVLGLNSSISEGEAVNPVAYDGIQVMSVGLMENRPTAWNGQMVHNALFNLIEDVDWSVNTLVVDLPPGASDTLMTLLQFVPIDGAVLVTTPHETSISDTNKGATLFREGGVPVLGVVVNMTGFKCPTCDDEHSLFQESNFDKKLDFPVLAELPFSENIRSFEGDIPEEIRHVAESVRENVVSDERPSVSENSFDVREYPPMSRIDEVREKFRTLDTGEELEVVSDQNPAGLAVGLVEMMGLEKPPSEVFDEYIVKPLDQDRWLLRIRKPAHK